MPEVNGQPGKMDWASYKARRKLDVKAWAAAKGFKSYKAMCSWLDAHGVEAPERSSLDGLFNIIKKKKVPLVIFLVLAAYGDHA